ncbi:hypothetical protein KR018_003885 [Drosophila ironensis]|nr:hypothetical protein KR018_003885 [Drosophila ironensis]
MGEGGAPPYGDLGKLARNLLRRNYHAGIWQFDCKTATSKNIDFLTTGNANQDYSKVFGSFQSTYKMEEHGLTLTERWNSDNWLFGEIMHRDKLAEGLMLAVEAKFQPGENDVDGKFKMTFARDNYHFGADIGLNSEALLNCALVVTHNEFLAGVGTQFDIGNTDLKMWKVALGWHNESATVHGELKNGESWLASLFYKLNEKIDIGAEVAKAGGDGDEEQGNDIQVTLGMIYHLEDSALIRAKISNAVEVGLGYEQKLSEGITASVSALLDGNNIKDGNHKFGVGLSMAC